MKQSSNLEYFLIYSALASMKLLGLLLLFCTPLVAQTNFSGTWQGVMVRDGYKLEQGTLVYASFQVNKNNLEGKFRDEIYNSVYFAVKKAKGTVNQNSLKFKQYVIEKKKNSTKSNWCNVEGELTYTDSTGYLIGRYSSSDCKGNSGKIIFYRSKLPFSATDTSPASAMWFDRFVQDFTKGYAAPEIRERERDQFIFQPVFFDYDEAFIRPEYESFLNKMVRVVEGHSDLRILVTGHTDADGSDEYNVDLSKRRAQALIDFFVSKGLAADRIQIDFKGESQPIDNNLTPEGKQRNRRVDFSFI
jgi:outer membrane protein OmpA-like peptidoglycan-associated protein